MSEHYKDYCMVCGKEVDDYKPRYCCNGRECGCQGLPVEPCVCSKECEDKVFGVGTWPFKGEKP